MTQIGDSLASSCWVDLYHIYVRQSRCSCKHVEAALQLAGARPEQGVGFTRASGLALLLEMRMSSDRGAFIFFLLLQQEDSFWKSEVMGCNF